MKTYLEKHKIAALIILVIIVIINFSFLKREFFDKIGFSIESSGESSFAQSRFKNLNKSNKKIVTIGVVAPIEKLHKGKHYLTEGIKFAAEVVNQQGGIDGKKIHDNAENEEHEG